MNYYIALSVDGSPVALSPYWREFKISEELYKEIAESVVNQVVLGKASRV